MNQFLTTFGHFWLFIPRRWRHCKTVVCHMATFISGTYLSGSANSNWWLPWSLSTFPINWLPRDGCAVVCSPTGFLLGVQSRHRSQALGLKGITSLASLDMYCFGHILYEVRCAREKFKKGGEYQFLKQMSFGRPLSTPTLDSLPPECPDIVSKFCSAFVLSPGLRSYSQPIQVYGHIHNRPKVIEIIYED